MDRADSQWVEGVEISKDEILNNKKRDSRSRSSSSDEHPKKKRDCKKSEDHSRETENGRSRSKSSSMDERDLHIVTLHGLPYSAVEQDIVDFLKGCSVVRGKKGVKLVYGEDKRVTGDCFVLLESEKDVERALGKHRDHLGHRYVEVFRATKSEMDYALRDKGSSSDNTVVRLRGLPYKCTKEEIVSFFLGLPIEPGGIQILTDVLGRTHGDAYVQFSDEASFEKALAKDKEKIRHRYIEVYRSTVAEMRARTSKFITVDNFSGPFGRARPSPYDRPTRFLSDMMPFGRMGGFEFGGMGQRGRFSRGDFGGGPMMRGRGMRGGGGGGSRNVEYISHTGHYIHMRGLPFSATEDDVAKFFEPVLPVNIYIDYNRMGRATGEANVDFDTATDARNAMKKHNNMMR